MKKFLLIVAILTSYFNTANASTEIKTCPSVAAIQASDFNRAVQSYGAWDVSTQGRFDTQQDWTVVVSVFADNAEQAITRAKKALTTMHLDDLGPDEVDTNVWRCGYTTDAYAVITAETLVSK